VNQIIPPNKRLVNHLAGLSGSAFDFFTNGEGRAAAMGLLEQRITEILETEGVSAFAMPRDAAAFHEAGHAVVSKYEAMPVKRVAIFQASVSDTAATLFGAAWAGRTSGSKKWSIGPDTSPIEDLKHSRIMLAGLASEVLFGAARSGSSLDELITAQLATAMVAQKLGVGGEQLWPKVWQQTAEICFHNRKVIDAIAERLLRCGSITGNALRQLLDDVEPVGRLP
jgi:hypothetical protein